MPTPAHNVLLYSLSTRQPWFSCVSCSSTWLQAEQSDSTGSLTTNFTITAQVDAAVTIWTVIWKVFGSNLLRVTGCPDWGSPQGSLVLQRNSGISFRSDHDRFLSNPFQLLINHPKIRRYETLDTDRVKHWSTTIQTLTWKIHVKADCQNGNLSTRMPSHMSARQGI
jgi:hypothetical protein